MPGSKKETSQQKFWASGFGKDYTGRNDFDPEALDKYYLEWYGEPRSKMNDDFLKELELKSILEVGSNLGNQLRLLEKQGCPNLTGVDVQEEAIKRARELAPGIKFIKASVFALPFPDGSFDLVFTSGVLIHISPEDLKDAIAEIYRVSKKYIWGFEYFSENYQEIEYRGYRDRLWKANFAKIYQDLFPDLKLVKEKKYKYQADQNVDAMFLLQKPEPHPNPLPGLALSPRLRVGAGARRGGRYRRGRKGEVRSIAE